MQRYALMAYSDVMHEWKRRTMRSCHYRFERSVMPEDKSWQVILLFIAVVGTFVVLFARWWLCV